ncbi:hypothetical protein SVA_1530 [Sulfurifustis variabilis]|uniref:Uncharacterized protein n=1 Tax=Sulfurifustis variabilis TaxID=1675686 RepID=A0A1B4V665_9GAMM|nr:hypothetical protein [Sulfurifustis variabilis]BAU48092.1 hypothetical protein SVA_1530 [Sulfurifustis variabilis]
MDGNRKRFSKGWFTGLVLGTAAAGGAAVYAVTLPHTFQDGQTASAAQVNANFAALRDALNGTGPCGSDADGMVRVGASCVDKDAKVVTAVPAGCEATGQGCAGIQVGAGPAVEFSWGQALAACTNAGKRLATAAEIIAGSNAGAITIADGSYSYVDASASRVDSGTGEPLVYAGTFVQFGPTATLPSGAFGLAGTNTPYTEQFDTVMFRCAR